MQYLNQEYQYITFISQLIEPIINLYIFVLKLR
jgi:hypothetical protein